MKFFGNKTSCVPKHIEFLNCIIYINVCSYTIASICLYFSFVIFLSTSYPGTWKLLA